MMWHTYLMVILTILYFVWKIYVYSLSLTFEYYNSDSNPSFAKRVKRKYKEIKITLKKYWEWYGLRHIRTPLIIWLIYGGIYIW